MTDCVLDEPSEQPKATAKLYYLQNQKQNLADMIRELTDNFITSKKIITDLSRVIQTQIPFENRMVLFSEVINKLIRINDSSQKLNEEQHEEISKLKCALLLKDQIQEQVEQENNTIIQQYEDKILELRRAIQDKQYLIQEKENTKPMACSSQYSKRENVQTKPYSKYICLIAQYLDPKQQVMRLGAEIEELKELIRKLTVENNLLRKKVDDSNRELTEQELKINKFQELLKAPIAYWRAKELYRRQNQRIWNSEERVAFRKQTTRASFEQGQLHPQNSMHPVMSTETREDYSMLANKKKGTLTQTLPSRNYPTISSGDGFYIRNESASYLRQLLFKEKRTSQILSKALGELTLNYAAVCNSNKLLAESNVNYQAKRAKLQNELKYYKHKNEDLLAIITKKRVRLNQSLCDPQEKLIYKTERQNKEETPSCQDSSRMDLILCLKEMRSQIVERTRNMTKVMNRGYINRLCDSRRIRHISHSCPIDYVMKEQPSSVQLFVSQQKNKLLKRRNRDRERDLSQSRISRLKDDSEDQPFLTEFSVIGGGDKGQGTHILGDLFKKKKLTESFLQISEQMFKN